MIDMVTLAVSVDVNTRARLDVTGDDVVVSMSEPVTFIPSKSVHLIRGLIRGEPEYSTRQNMETSSPFGAWVTSSYVVALVVNQE